MELKDYNMSEGYVRIPRMVEDYEWIDDKTVGYFYWRLYFVVNYKGKTWHGIEIPPGSGITSIQHLCDRMGMSKNTVKKCLHILIQSGALKEKVIDNQCRLLSITDYVTDSPTGQNLTGQRSKNDSRGQKMTGQRSKFDRTGQQMTVSLTPTKERKKYSSPLRGKNTAYPPARLVGGGRVPPEQPSAAMPYTQTSAAMPYTQPSAAMPDSQPSTAVPSNDAPPKGIALVPAKEMLDFASRVPGGQREVMWAFRSAFESSGTRMPAEWQDFYVRFAAADVFQQDAFLQKLKAGDYREKWGVLDADT